MTKGTETATKTCGRCGSGIRRVWLTDIAGKRFYRWAVASTGRLECPDLPSHYCRPEGQGASITAKPRPGSGSPPRLDDQRVKR